MKLKPDIKAMAYFGKESSKEIVSWTHQKNMRGREIREQQEGLGKEKTKTTEIVKPQGFSQKHQINTNAYLTAAICFKINY